MINKLIDFDKIFTYFPFSKQFQINFLKLLGSTTDL